LARAKRTDRTEARRRHREEQAAVGAVGIADARASTSAVAAGGSTKPAPAPAPRPSITAALRGSFRPLDLAGDLRALPRLLLHWSFWGPALATIIGSVVFIVWAQTWVEGVAPSTFGTVAYLAFQMLVYPVPAPAGAAFIAGFGAPRASWLVGLLIGVIAAVCYTIVLYSVPVGLLVRTEADIQPAALSALLTAPVGSALFAAAAAWYKRFLNLANPNRNQRRSQAAARPAQGRGDIKRDRLSRS
jgi:hypothetical protein